MTAPRQRAARPFEEIVAEHGALVMRMCRALVGPVDAADAWSETFLSALQAYPRLPAGSNIEYANKNILADAISGRQRM